MLRSWSSICSDTSGGFWLQIARRNYYFSQSCLSELNVIWLAIIKEGKSVWSDVHHRPKRPCSDLMQYWVCCGGGRKKYKMSNITGQFSFWWLPEPGGVSVHLVSHSWSSLCFPCSHAGPDGTFMLSIRWPQGYLLLFVWGCQVSRQKQTWSPPTPQWPPWSDVQWVRPCHQLRARRCRPFLPFPVHTLSWRWVPSWRGGGLLAALSPSTAVGSPGFHSQGLHSPLPVHSPAQERHGTSFPRGELGGLNPSHSSFCASLHAHATTRYVFRN